MLGKGDPFFFEHLLNDVPLTDDLLATARAMEGLFFWHGTRQKTVTFRFQLVEPCLLECVQWAETCNLADARQAVGVQQLATLRAWTCTPLCYVLCDVMRSPERTKASVQPVLGFYRLLISAMQGLPEKYLYKDGTLFRAERGVMTTWDNKMYEGGVFSFYVPTSFSREPGVLRTFKGNTGLRTVFIVSGASGVIMDQFSKYPEAEVLLEPVCHFQVLAAKKYDANHLDVQMGEVEEGLHRTEGHVRPGIALLEGSRIKAFEEEAYRNWRRKPSSTLSPDSPAPRPPGQTAPKFELEYAPFSEEEWQAMGKKVPKKDAEQKMSLLGKGAFMSTFRKLCTSSEAPEGSHPTAGRRYAVKVIEREDMENQGITEAHVRREAKILGSLRHTHVIGYYEIEDTDDSMGLVMELAEGGSLAGLIKRRVGEGGVQISEVLEVMRQLASAMDYIHGEGIVHRDVKADNILLAHADGAGRVCAKLADFGVATVLATVAGSSPLLSKVRLD